MSEARLQKLLARSGAGSRRGCERLIEEGRVTVNGRVAHLGDKADPDRDEVCLDGQPLGVPEKRIVIALHKPCGYLSAMSDDRGRRCASELLPLQEHPSLFHVGRLDADTSGLLLFTTDGELGHALAHPSHEVIKEYVADVEGLITEADLQRLRQGIMLEDGMTAPAEAELLDTIPGRVGEASFSHTACDERRGLASDVGQEAEMSVVRLRIHEGRNRQVRRMMDAVGHPVRALRRTAIGAVRLEGLEVGAWRCLDEAEVESLFRS